MVLTAGRMRGEDRNPLEHLAESEQVCVRRYVARLTTCLGENLEDVVLFGSAARGDMWSASSPRHSDIDLLVLTREPLTAALQEELLNETYPLYLECGRQISPQWRTVSQFEAADSERGKVFKEIIGAEGRVVYHRSR